MASTGLAIFLLLAIGGCLAKPNIKVGKPALPKKLLKNEGTERWGYYSVRPGAHMFWWLYYTTHSAGWQNRPLVLWLQGGPGGSSTGIGNFDLIGPLDTNLMPRNTTWVQSANVIFIDQPVGTGYSYVDYPEAYTTDNEQIGADLVTMMKEFMRLFPGFQTVPFYTFGQSYGGKMASSFTRLLNQAIQAGDINCNLGGYAMGNSWIHPMDSLSTWGPFLYWMSNLDEKGLQDVQGNATAAQTAVDEGRWVDAVTEYVNTQYAINYHADYVDFYNVLKYRYAIPGFKNINKMTQEEFKKYSTTGHLHTRSLNDLMNGPIREKLGIIPSNVTWGGQASEVFDYLEADFMKPVVDIVSEMLQSTTINVIVYQGQLDVICDTKGAMDWVQRLTWSNMDTYFANEKFPYTDPRDGQTEMFVKSHQRFKFYWILRGGHSVAKDVGDASLRMLNRILDNVDQ